MYGSFEVRNYRCFDDLKLEGLERFNLITGVNNVGKTTLLEALFLHVGAYNPSLTIKVQAFRGFEVLKFELARWADTPWDSLFPDFDRSKTVELMGRTSTNGLRVVRLRLLREPEDLERAADLMQANADAVRESPLAYQMSQVLELEYEEGQRLQRYLMILGTAETRVRPTPPPPPFPGVFLGARVRVPLSEDTERFGKLQVEGQEQLLLDALRVLEPRLTRLTVVVARGGATIHGDIGLKKLVPLPDMGEGMARLTSLVLAIIYSKEGVVLIDEFENGLHHSVLSKVWQAVAETARRFDAQVFATTHSWESVVAAQEVFSRSASYDFRLHRLERVRDGIRAVAYDQDTLQAAIEAPLEVR